MPEVSKNVKAYCASTIVPHPSKTAKGGAASAVLHERVDLLHLHVFHVRSDVPLISERIFHSGIAVAIGLVGGFLE